MKTANAKGIQIKIGGDTKGLDEALKDINKSTKDLQSELRGVETLLKLDPKNVDLLRQKETVLNKAIDETNDKLKILKEAQQQMADNGIDENSEAYRDLQREIILTENKLESLEEEQRQFVDEASKVDSVGQKFADAGDKLKSAGESMRAVSAACAGALAGLTALAVKAGATADDINTLSKQTGLSTDSLQKFQYATELIDVQLSDVAKGLARVTKAAAKDSDVFEKLRVNTRDSSGELRSAEEIFYDTVDALGKVENLTERNALANELFGKSYMNLNPLIEGGADDLRALSEQFDKLGLSLDQADLDKANEFNDQIDIIKATWQQAMLIMGASLADNFGPLLEGVAEKIAMLANAFASLPSAVQGSILALLGIGAVLAPLLITLGQLTMGIGMLMPLLSRLPSVLTILKGGLTAIGTAFNVVRTAAMGLWAVMAANPVTIVIAVIAALVAAFVILWNKCAAFRNFWKNLWANIKQLASTAATKIKEVFSELPQKMLSIGSNIVKGLWNGISGAAGWIKEKISGFVSGIISSFQSFFGIASPSKEMAKQVGKWIPAGVAEGIKNNMGSVKKAVGSMGDVVLNAPNMSYAGMTDEISNAIGTGLAVQGSGVNMPNSIHVVVEMGGTKVGEQIVNLYDYTKKALG